MYAYDSIYIISASSSSSAMPLKGNAPRTDLHLNKIHEGSPSALIEQLLAIQSHAVSRKKAESSAPGLRLFGTTDIITRKSKKQNCEEDDQFRSSVRRLAEDCGHTKGPAGESHNLLFVFFPWPGKGQNIGGKHYIAISWRWLHDYLSLSSAAVPNYQHRVQRSGRARSKGKFTDIYFDRAILSA